MVVGSEAIFQEVWKYLKTVNHDNQTQIILVPIMEKLQGVTLTSMNPGAQEA